mmetsp:Transcript_19815/g.24538  ORF Transcript_19815/g.24538 Transcript_19815/m.24538 type:complete len:138 (+) Transcript_19815:65-478(+)
MIVAKILSGLMGFFFTFAGIAKTTPYTAMSEEMQMGFRSGLFPKMWGLPALPFLYFVGITELLCGIGLLGSVFGITPQLITQWCAVIPIPITMAATTSHVLNGDPMDKIVFCGVITTLFVLNNFFVAISFATKVKGA